MSSPPPVRDPPVAVPFGAGHESARVLDQGLDDPPVQHDGVQWAHGAGSNLRSKTWAVNFGVSSASLRPCAFSCDFLGSQIDPHFSSPFILADIEHALLES